MALQCDLAVFTEKHAQVPDLLLLTLDSPQLLRLVASSEGSESQQRALTQTHMHKVLQSV